MIVNSGEVQYHGKEIKLVGQVNVQHDLGQISADHLSLCPLNQGDKGTKFTLLKVDDNVHMRLKNGGELKCQHAEVDYLKLEGRFLGNGDHPDVCYYHLGEEGEKKKAPIDLKSVLMTFELAREESPSLSNKIELKQIIAEENVRLHYNNDFLLLADHALYQQPTSDAPLFTGFLTLTVKGSLPACTMINLNEDRLTAQMIQLDIAQKTLFLTSSMGTLYLRRKNQSPQVIGFSSQKLMWDDQKHHIQLTGNVDITQNQFFHLHTNHEISILQINVDGEKRLQSIRSLKETEISYSDDQKNQMHKIYCPALFVIDHEHQVMTLEGSFEGETSLKQVYIEDVMGEMYADRVVIHYQWVDGRIVIDKLILEGNVNIMNRFGGKREESGNILHYALADRVECFPKEQELVLMSTSDNRVLFLDKGNNIQMSAPSLKVRHDPATKKEVIQGFGDVRFTFIDKELFRLKNQFSEQTGAAK